jgi:hypothetical protein
MTQDYETGLPSDQAGSTAQTAKDQAAGVAKSAAQSGSHLAGEAKTQAVEVGREAGRQAKDILGQGKTQVAERASEQQRKLADGFRTFGADLDAMASAPTQGGMATDLVRQVSNRVGSMAGWLESREPADIIEDVKAYARRRPGTFLLVAAGAGLLAGRLTRGIRDGSSDTMTGGGQHRAPGMASTDGYGLQTAGVGTSSTYGTAAYGTGSTYGTGTGSTYGTGTGSTYGEGQTEGFGLGDETSYGSASPTTQGSSDETVAFSAASAAPYLGAPDTYGTGTENPPGDATGYEGDGDRAGVFGGGTTEVPEHELESGATWPPVEGEEGRR